MALSWEKLSILRFRIVSGISLSVLLALLLAVTIYGGVTKPQKRTATAVLSASSGDPIPTEILFPEKNLVPSWPHHLNGDFVRTFPWNGCCNTSNIDSFPSNLVLVGPGNCSLEFKLKQIQRGNPAVIILTVDPEEPLLRNESLYLPEIPAAVLISSEYVDAALDHLGTSGSLYRYERVVLDPTVVILWVLAMVTVVLAGSWQKATRRKAEIEHALNPSEQAPPDRVRLRRSAGMAIMTSYTLALVVTALFSQFLSRIRESVELIFFCIGGFVGLFYCLRAVFDLTRLQHLLVFRRLLKRKRVLPRRLGVLTALDPVLALCAFLVLLWFVLERRAPYSWVLQGIIGLSFLALALLEIDFLTFRLLLALEVAYFVSSLAWTLTVDPVPLGPGASILEYLRAPQLCGRLREFAFLRVTDVIIPGILMVYLCFLDSHLKQRHPAYQITGVCGYLSGLVIASGIMVFTEAAFSAALCIIPATLLLVLLVGSRHKHLHMLWRAPSSAAHDYFLEGVPLSILTHREVGPESVSILQGNSDDEAH